MIYRVVLDGVDILNFQEKPYVLVEPNLTMELNAAGSFEFMMPPSHACYDSVRPLLSTVEVYEDGELIWFGRPVEIRTDFYRQEAVYCEGALAFFNDSVQRPHEYQRISLHEFFRTVIANHNAQVGGDRRFTVGSITVPDRTVYRKLNYDQTFDVLKRQCLSAEGGYLFLRREGGENFIDWHKEMPLEGNQPVEFGLNMSDLSRVFDGAQIATCVLPLGEEDEETGKPLTVESVNNGSDVIESDAVAEYGHITKAVPFNGVSHADTLFEDGLEYLASTQFENMTVECSAADLHWQNGNYGLFRLGQKIHCRSVPHLLDRHFDLLKMTLRLDTAQKKITLGSVKRQTLTEITKEASAGAESMDGRIEEAAAGAAEEAISYVDDAIAGFDETVTDLGAEITDAQTDLGIMQDSYTAMQNDMSEVQSGLAEMQGQIDELRQAVSGDQWIHQIDGMDAGGGTINFVTMP